MMQQIANTHSEDTGSKAANLRNRQLVAASDLHARVKQVRSSLRGPAVAETRALLKNLAAAVESYSEKTAGLGSSDRSARDSGLMRHRKLGIDGEEAEIAALITAFADFGDAMRKAGDEATASGDAEGSEAFIGMSHVIDYELWAVEAHLADQRERRRRRAAVPAPYRLGLTTRCEQLSFLKPCGW
jgi:DNA-binding ferritin-like protein